jgi:hypothetical protein
LTTAEQIAAMARLADAHKQLDKTAAGDGDGAEQANAIIKQCEIDAGVSTEEINVEDTPVNKTNWKTEFIKLRTELIKLVNAVKHDGKFDMLDRFSQAAVTRLDKLYNSSVFPPDPQPTKLTTPPKPHKEKNVKPCVEHNLLDCTRCAKRSIPLRTYKAVI